MSPSRYLDHVRPSTALVKAALDHAFDHMEGNGSAHDPWHLVRVFRTTQRLAEAEDGVTIQYAELIAALHDVEDFKTTGDDTSGARAAQRWLRSQGAGVGLIDVVSRNVAGISFKGAGTPTLPLTIDGKVVQDADRLDATGMIGVARCFDYGGGKDRPIHDPDVEVAELNSTEAYLAHQGTSINHFYEKTLLLPERMNTAAGKRLAEQRHQKVLHFLDEFFAEWEGAR